MHRTFLPIVSLTLCAGLVSLTPTNGQPVPTEETRILSFGVIPSNGSAAIDIIGGLEDGLLSVSCAGNTPIGGPVVPLAVMSDLGPHVISVRVVSWASGDHLALVNKPGVTVTSVSVTCAIDAPTSFWEIPAVAAKVAQLRQQARQ